MKVFSVHSIGRLLFATALASALMLGIGVMSPEVSSLLSDLVTPVVAIGASLVLVLGAITRHGRDRVSWLLFGAGVGLFGLGELFWSMEQLLTGKVPGFPGVPDIFYLSAYPAMISAMLVAPRLAANGYQRGQQILDGVVITAGSSILAWMTVLEPMYAAAGQGDPVGLAVAAGYPIGDVLLVATVGAVGIRRTQNLGDRSLWCVSGAMIVLALGDLIYLTETWTSEYSSGSPLDAAWLVGYGLLALAATWLTEPAEERHSRDRRLPFWHVFIPMGMVMSIVVLNLSRRVGSVGFGPIALEITVSVLGLLVLARIGVTVGEDRHLVDEERKRLISVVSHELRTPLTAVQGYLDLALSDTSLDESERSEILEIARDQAHVVTRIVTDLVATSRDNLHATALDLEPVDLGTEIQRVVTVSELGAKTSIERSEPITVLVDRGRFAQILTNLLTNADRYGGGVTTCVIRRFQDEVEIAIHDNGLGVPQRYQSLIWSPFERGEHRFDASTPGSGLGLALVRSLVEAHGGRVGYRPSERLGGACFWLRLVVIDLSSDNQPAQVGPRSLTGAA